MTVSRKECLNRLDYYYRAIDTTIISRQNPASGLIPASVAITVSTILDDYWVGDKVLGLGSIFFY